MIYFFKRQSNWSFLMKPKNIFKSFIIEKSIELHFLNISLDNDKNLKTIPYTTEQPGV